MSEKGMIIEAKSNWIPIDFDWKEFEGLNGIEELKDYKLIGKETKKEILDDKKCQKKKKCKISDKSDNNSKQKLAAELFNSETCETEKCIKKRARKFKQESKIARKKIKLKKEFEEENVTSIENAKNLQDMSAWNDCFVPAPILKALSELNFTYPTPIQALTLPSAIRDRMDILGAAETGSGKTLAFGIPVIHFILEDKMKESKNSENSEAAKEYPLRALILTPTRELAIQIRNHLRKIVKYTDIKIEVVIGGMSQQKQERLLKRYPDIVVATPGRLWELIETGNPHLSQAPNVKYLVVDEADRMIEKGHFSELLQLLQLINGSGSTERHTYVYSATLTLIHDTPKRVVLKKKKFKMTQEKKLDGLIKIIGMKEKHKVVDLTRKLGTVETLTETCIRCSLEEKDVYLYYFLLTYPGRTLLFCNSIDCVRRLRSILTLINYNPLPLHASMHQRQRLKNLDRFSSDPKGLLLATDVAARGLDIVGIEHVIHYQVPRTAEIYVHRSGRTARATKQGLSLMLISPQEINFYRRLCKSLNRDEELPTFPVDTILLRPIKERITLVKKIDKMEHSQRKHSAQTRWLQEAAREMDIDIEDEQFLDTDKLDYTDELKIIKKQLDSLLKKPLRLQGYYGSFITKSGKLSFKQEKVLSWNKIKSSKNNNGNR